MCWTIVQCWLQLSYEWKYCPLKHNFPIHMGYLRGGVRQTCIIKIILWYSIMRGVDVDLFLMGSILKDIKQFCGIKHWQRRYSSSVLIDHLMFKPIHQEKIFPIFQEFLQTSFIFRTLWHVSKLHRNWTKYSGTGRGKIKGTGSFVDMKDLKPMKNGATSLHFSRHNNILCN